MSWKNDPATSKQLELLSDLSYSLTRPKTKGDASVLIDALKAGLGPIVAQDRMFRFQAGLPLDQLPARQASESSAGALLGCFLIVGGGLVFIFCCGGLSILGLGNAEPGPVAMPAAKPRVIPATAPQSPTLAVEPTTVSPEPTPEPAPTKPIALPVEQPVEPEPPKLSQAELIENAKWRTWRAAEGGFSVEAKFISYIGTKAKLEKRDGKVITVDLGILVEDDAAFIREQRWLKAE